MGGQADHHESPAAAAPKQAGETPIGASGRRFVRAMFTMQVHLAEVGKSPYKRAC
jgi:hypothetical protein